METWIDQLIGSFATNSMKIEATYEKLRAEILGVGWGRVQEVQGDSNDLSAS